jgi:uncharacterized protein with PIN domain
MSSDNKHLTKNKTTVQIEEVDESWALILLNESEQEDYAIKLERGQNESDFYQGELSLIKSTKEPDSNNTHIKVIDDHLTKSLSAIENQIQAQAQKKYNKYTEMSSRKQKLNSSLLRLKSFFVA